MHELTEQFAEKVCDFVGDNFNTEARVYSKYSGRGMYGEQCTGIVASDSSAMEIGAAMAFVAIEEALEKADVDSEVTWKLRDILDEALEKVGQVAPGRTDNLGYDTIYY